MCRLARTPGRCQEIDAESLAATIFLSSCPYISQEKA
jgi:hypothetical protein